ncbi:6631_t:CDS:2, partial [Racocetra fulgida]
DDVSNNDIEDINSSNNVDLDISFNNNDNIFNEVDELADKDSTILPSKVISTLETESNAMFNLRENSPIDYNLALDLESRKKFDFSNRILRLKPITVPDSKARASNLGYMPLG